MFASNNTAPLTTCIDMRQVAGNLYVGRFRVPRKRGDWKIEVLNFTSTRPGHTTRVLVRSSIVVGRGGSTSPPPRGASGSASAAMDDANRMERRSSLWMPPCTDG
jgi:hypothetical protein